MNLRQTFAKGAVLLALAGTTIGIAQAPEKTIDLAKHPNLGGAQQLVIEAYQKVVAGQAANHDKLGDHGEKAKHLLVEASHELTLAAEASNADEKAMKK